MLGVIALWPLVQAGLMFVNGFAVLNNERFLEKYGCGFSQMGSGDGTSPGHNALKSQIVGFLFAAAYMRVPLVVVNTIVIFIKIIFG